MAQFSSLERLALGVAVASVVLVAGTAAAVARPGVRAALGLSRGAYAARQRIDIPAQAYDSASYTLVLFARSSCAACQRSSIFFKQLVAEAVADGIDVRLVSSAPVASEELAYARELGFEERQVVPLDLRALRLRLVPTIVLVDRQGEIHYAREGAVPAGEQGDLLRRMTSLTKAR